MHNRISTQLLLQVTAQHKYSRLKAFIVTCTAEGKFARTMQFFLCTLHSERCQNILKNNIAFEVLQKSLSLSTGKQIFAVIQTE